MKFDNCFRINELTSDTAQFRIHLAGPVAQSVESWAPCVGSTRSCCKSSRFEARWALDVYETPGEYGCGWWQAIVSQSRLRDRPYVVMLVHKTLDSELRNQRVEDRANSKLIMSSVSHQDIYLPILMSSE